MARDGQAIRILVVDDHPLMREGISKTLEAEPGLQVVGEASDGVEAIEAYRVLSPDIVLIDLQMPRLSGLDAVEEIRKTSPDAKITVLTTYGGDAFAERALELGALGFLLKSSLHRELVDAIWSVNSGRRYMSAPVAEQLLAYAAKGRLSERELAVLRLVARGEANKLIARRLSISDQTVKAHVKSIFCKLEVGDRTHAVTVAIRRGLIEI